MKIDTIIFDLGNVLVSWNPANLFEKIIHDKQELHYFLHNICTMEWHTLQDGGRSPEEGTRELLQKYPEWEVPIRAFYTRWKEMFDGAIESSVQILKELKDKGYKVYALSNWNRELYDQTVDDFPFLNWFDGKIISSEEKMKKPDENIYHLLFKRYNIAPQRAVFIDDNPDNIATGERLGLRSILFTTPEALRKELETLQIL
jgi:2-haloacid dehalogenase